MGIADLEYNDVANATLGNNKKKPGSPAQGMLAPPVQPAPAAPSSFSFGKSPPPTIYGNGGLPAPVVQAGIDTMKGQLATPGTPAAQSQAAAPSAPSSAVPAQGILAPSAKPVDTSSGPTVSDGAGGVYTPERGSNPGAAVSNFFKDSAEAARGEKSFDQIRAERAAGATSQPGAPAAPLALSSAVPAQAAAPSAVPADAAASPTSAPSNGTPPATTGRNEKGIITAESAMAAYGNNATGHKGVKGKADIFGTYDGAAVNGILARENAVRQSIIDKEGVKPSWQAQYGNADPEKQRIAESNALLGKWGIEDQLKKMSPHQQVQYLNAQTQAQTAQRGQDMNYQATMSGQGITARGQDVSARGQDVAAQSEANRLAGNPVDNKLKQAQTTGILAQNDSAAMLAEIQKKALAGDAQAMASYQALTGKNQPSYKAIHAAGGQTLDGKNPDQVFVIDERTGNARALTGGQSGQGGAPKFSSPAEVAAAKAAGTIKSGDVVETPNGLIKVK